MKAFVASVMASFFVACGGGAPTITAITSLDPSTVPVGVASLLTGQVAITDDDGNLETLQVTLTTPSKETVSSSIEVGEEAGKARNSTVSLRLQVLPPEAGIYRIAVVAVDGDGNESEARTAEFTAANAD